MKKTVALLKRTLEKQGKALVLRAKIILTTAENSDWTDSEFEESVFSATST